MNCVTLLRGINVSGQKIIKMDELAKIFSSFGFKNVRTYIQSGNILFESVKSESILVKVIETGLQNKFGYSVTAIVRTVDEMNSVIRNNPFKKLTADKFKKLYVTFLAAVPDKKQKDGLLNSPNDTEDFKIVEREVYILCNKGFGETKFNNNHIEKKLGVRATTRNWNTVCKLVTL